MTTFTFDLDDKRLNDVPLPDGFVIPLGDIHDGATGDKILTVRNADLVFKNGSWRVVQDDDSSPMTFIPAEVTGPIAFDILPNDGERSYFWPIVYDSVAGGSDSIIWNIPGYSTSGHWALGNSGKARIRRLDIDTNPDHPRDVYFDNLVVDGPDYARRSLYYTDKADNGDNFFYMSNIAPSDSGRAAIVADTISGRGGNDVMLLGIGNDRGLGGAGNDVLFGENGRDRLLGQENRDYISGGAGGDTLIGGAGFDTLVGGTEADVFLFESLKDFGFAPGQRSKKPACDLIDDFYRKQNDKIDLAGIDANISIGSDQPFKFIGSAEFHRKAAELRVDVGLVYGDVDGDGKADFCIRLNTGIKLVVNDFDL